MTEQDKNKVCFVIAPIGKDASPTRQRSDQVLKHIVEPAASECGYQTMRADSIESSGIITAQIIEHLFNDPMVVADLTESNANVFYELGVRHTVRKPVIQMIEDGETIPFDVAQLRTIKLNTRDPNTMLDRAADARQQLVKQIRATEVDPSRMHTPVSVAGMLASIQPSDNPLSQSATEIISMLQAVSVKIDWLSREFYRPGLGEWIGPGTLAMYRKMMAAATLGKDERPTTARFDELATQLKDFEPYLHYVMIAAGMDRDEVDKWIGRAPLFPDTQP
jgi:hypothetical protein